MLPFPRSETDKKKIISLSEKRFDMAKKEIISFFDTENEKVYSFRKLSALFFQKKKNWKFPADMRVKDFTAFLEKTKLKPYRFDFSYAPVTLYSWGDVSVFDLTSHIKKDSYFTHYSAVFLHELTEQIPKTVYLNFEQPEKHFSTAGLTQENIDKAFSKPQRISQNIATAGDYRVCLLNGKYTDRLGVTEMTSGEGRKLYVTNTERTLIDITVRPAYAGGPFEVLKAFRNAKEIISINRLLALLKKMNFIYPYHQAIGFYLEKAGYRADRLKLMERFEKKYRFYLVHNMKETDFSEKWQIFYPKGL